MTGTDAPHVRGPGRWIGDPATFHGEGAFWDDDADVLRHVDMLAGGIITWDGDKASRRTLGDVAAVIRRRERGGFVVALQQGFALLDDALDSVREIPVFDDARIRMNEGACDPRGRLFCGTMAYDATPGAGTLYRLDADLTVTPVLHDLTIPNGLVWTPDGRSALHVDTPAAKVYRYAYDLETGIFGDREVHLDLGDEPGKPDGMAADDEGGLWIALWGGACVRRYDADGRCTDTIPLDVTNPTSCAFGGPEGRTLFITSSKQGIDVDAEAHAGLVYEIETTLQGAPVHRFAG